MDTIPKINIDCFNYYTQNIGDLTPFFLHDRIIHRVNLTIQNQPRYFLYVEPHNLCQSKSVIIYYHGSRGNAYETMLDTTNLIETHSGPLIFAQAFGEHIHPFIHPTYNHVSYGELYFEIRDVVPQFKIDLEYTQNIVDYLHTRSFEDLFLVGHSNGGVFALLVMLHMDPNTFKGIVSHMGGIGFDPHYYLDFSKFETFRTGSYPRILIYTGENDLHLEPCIQAKNIFEAYDFKIDFFVRPNTIHMYDKDFADSYIIRWIETVVKDGKN